MAILLSLSPHPPKPHQNPNPSTPKPISLSAFQSTALFNSSRRQLILNAPSLCFLSLILTYPVPKSRSETLPSKSILSGIASTKSWSQFYGDGFAIRVPPQFADITEPEDYNAGLSLYGDKAKPKTFAARFASSDGRHKEMLGPHIQSLYQRLMLCATGCDKLGDRDGDLKTLGIALEK
ncbi:tagatose-6-phosphate ketose/aldose isomerase, putative [Actinidia rufa]|uniref:Tagatose-6-phosphate ketose/aldose isomerase, putative n=1 Tax=Actinidia rufa TaxID=165716 RepID=A0A7J0FWG6_9ERIC|nr:tagatose-6-phosphate ketose/aldose isomerase, putative [Actinidia rufa]